MEEILVSEIKILDDCLKQNLINCNINFLFPVQSKVIPFLLQDSRNCLIRPRDLCVSAPTGSGKTLAYVLPIVQSLRSRVTCANRAVVILPVIELAVQVNEIFQTYIRGTDLKVVLLTGKKSFSAEQKALVKADIITSTPSRILDHIFRTPEFSLQRLQFLVIDEADRMIENIQRGFLRQVEEAVYKDVDNIDCKCFTNNNEGKQSAELTACSFSSCSKHYQTLLFSATLSNNKVKYINQGSLYKPKFIICQSAKFIGKCSIPQELAQHFVVCKSELKPMVLCHYILAKNFKKVLCFTQSKQRSHRLNLLLKQMGFVKSKEISSNKSSVGRKITCEQFEAGKINVLVSSDLLARGLDFKSIDCVVSYDLPKSLTQHIHRIGRTARAFQKGNSLNLVTEGELCQFKKMLKSFNTSSMPIQLTFNEELLEKYIEPLKSLCS